MNRNWIPCYDEDLINQYNRVWDFVKAKYYLPGNKPKFFLNKYKSTHNLGIFTASRTTGPVIVLNEAFVNHKDRSLNTIIHEMCHYVAYQKFGRSCGHDIRWKNIGKVVGSYFGEKITTYCSSEDAVLNECRTHHGKETFKYVVRCGDCGRKFSYKRKHWWMNLDTGKCPGCTCPCGAKNLKVEVI